MRISKFPLLAVVLALGAVGCKTDNGALTASTTPPLAYVRYVNALPDTMNTTVRWVDFIEFTPQTFVNVAYRAFGQGMYQGLKPGSRHFKIFNSDIVNYSVAGNTAVLTDQTLSFEAGKYYTILFTGYARGGGQKVVVFEDVIAAPGSNVALRVLNANTGLGAVDVYKLAAAGDAVTGSPTIAAVAEQKYSSYATFAPGAFALRVANAANPTGLGTTGTAAPTGTAGTTSADPIGGATVAGTVMTAMVFPASVTGSTALASTTPSIVFIVDKQPPRTTSP